MLISVDEVFVSFPSTLCDLSDCLVLGQESDQSHATQGPLQLNVFTGYILLSSGLTYFGPYFA
jgi:hypothetical protein